MAISPKNENKFVEDLCLCICYWEENHVPLRIRKLAYNLLQFACSKNELRQSHFDMTSNIINQKGYYIKKAKRNIVLKVLHHLKRRQGAQSNTYADYERKETATNDFSKCFDEYGNLEPHFVDMFSVTNTTTSFGIDPALQQVTVYTDRVDDVKQTAHARLQQNGILNNNLEFVKYSQLTTPPDINIEFRTALHAGSSVLKRVCDGEPRGTIGAFARLKVISTVITRDSGALSDLLDFSEEEVRELSDDGSCLDCCSK